MSKVMRATALALYRYWKGVEKT